MNSTPTTPPALHIGYSTYRVPTPPVTLGSSSPHGFFSGPSSPSPSTRATSPPVDVPRASSVSPLPPIPSPNLLSKTLPPVPSSTSPPPAPGTPRIKLTLPNSADEGTGNAEETGPKLQSNGKSKAVDGLDGASPPPTPSTSAGSQPSMRPPSLRSTGSTFRHIPVRSSKPPNPSPLRPSSSARTFSTSSQPVMSSRAGSSQHFSRPSLDSAFSRPQSQQSIAAPSSSGRPSTMSSPAVAPSIATPIPEGDALRLPAPSSNAVPPSAVSAPTKPSAPSPLAVDTLPPPTRSSISNSGSSTAPSTPATPFLVPGNGKSVSRGTGSKEPPPTPSSAISTSTSKPGLAPYRPGFQPKGVYSVRTDDFMSLRSQRLESRRAEEKRLLRRLEKACMMPLSFVTSNSPLESIP
ncbi:hypothetical protein FS837_011493 [Tulasnella sp. UAMH 9824]|nr:hypothetical protein FS837_011493 [Tulasnella sp. UAMH 9824]